jgi:hypothetical protein
VPCPLQRGVWLAVPVEVAARNPIWVAYRRILAEVNGRAVRGEARSTQRKLGWLWGS